MSSEVSGQPHHGRLQDSVFTAPSPPPRPGVALFRQKHRVTSRKAMWIDREMEGQEQS